MLRNVVCGWDMNLGCLTSKTFLNTLAIAVVENLCIPTCTLSKTSVVSTVH